MISIEHSLNVTREISHLVRADKHRNIQFIHNANKLEALLEFSNYLGLANGPNSTPMSSGSICDMYKVGIEVSSQ
jgi:hypothetical protein